MKLGKISKEGMDNLMSVVREIGESPEDILRYLLENPESSLEEAKCYGIKNKEKREISRKKVQCIRG